MQNTAENVTPILSAHDRLQAGIKNMVPLGELSKLYTAYVLAEMGNNKVHASEKLQIDRRTIQRWEASGTGPARRIRSVAKR